MSPIGIRQQIGFLGRNYTWRTMTDEQLVHDAELIEEALRDWQAHFPNDTWLAPTAFHLEGLYGEIQTPDARQHAARMLQYIVEHWPKSKYAHASRIRLANGFPPLHEEPSMRPTIPPATPTPVETPTPAPTPTPTATPTATPTPTEPPRGRGRRSAPSPTPTPTVSPSPPPPTPGTSST
ncbi:MAG: hypothetical protein JO359_00110 [Candidatus Eremiobacteraeota bacterium]|nr:hypothetical protein [Candidatus Eremiobacteraeota bacterium]